MAFTSFNPPSLFYFSVDLHINKSGVNVISLFFSLFKIFFFARMYVRLSRAEGKFTNRRLKWNWRQNALCEYNIIVFLFFFYSVCIIFCVYRVFLAYIIRKTYYICKRVRVSPVCTGTRGLDDVDWKRKEETFLFFQIGMSRLRILELSNDRVAAHYPCSRVTSSARPITSRPARRDTRERKH